MDLTLTNSEIVKLKACGKILSFVLSELIKKVKPGMNGGVLDSLAEELIRKQGGKPSFKNYGPKENPFPASICLSVNNEIVHGLPYNKIIQAGDIVSIDLGVEYQGVFSDSARTVIAGKALNPQDNKLIKITWEALNIAKNISYPGKYTGDIGYSIQKFVEGAGFSVVRALVGHGIGKSAHQEPHVPNFGHKNEGFKLVPNMAIAIEPMVNIGSSEVITDNDGWSVKTFDGKKSAHFEDTVLITNGKPIIIT